MDGELATDGHSDKALHWEDAGNAGRPGCLWLGTAKMLGLRSMAPYQGKAHESVTEPSKSNSS